MNKAWLLPTAGVCLAIGYITPVLFADNKPPPCPKLIEKVGLAEVTDLINRLKPLANSPNSEYVYINGIQITFYGKGVQLVLKQENGNEYHVKADSLREAVQRITTPSEEIKNALTGW